MVGGRLILKGVVWVQDDVKDLVAVADDESFVGSGKVADVAEWGVRLGSQALEHADPLIEARLLLRLVVSEF